MSTKLIINTGLCNEGLESCDVHSIPCKIHFDGEARVSNFFKPIAKDGSDEFKASFRGYPLEGKRIDLSANYVGFVVKETNTSDESRDFSVSNTFKSITYWNWNKKPTLNDPFLSALDWMEISEAVHNPIEED